MPFPLPDPILHETLTAARSCEEAEAATDSRSEVSSATNSECY